MGEYGTYAGRRVKLGVCEDMLYLRATQAALIEGVRGGLCAVRDAIRFRFPWPDEDGTEPGAFDDPFRELAIDGLRAPEDMTHNRGECDRGGVRLFQQRYWEGHLVAVCRCGCGALYRLPDPDMGIALADALRAMADEAQAYGESESADWMRTAHGRHAVWLRTVALRVLDGYRDGAGEIIAADRVPA